MAAANFTACLAVTLEFEGGYVNDPNDPGGETHFGISKRAYPDEDIRGMTLERATAIYRRDYWDPIQGDLLPAGIDLCTFDSSVNSGRSRGAKWLQRALVVEVDGIIGPVTLAAVMRAPTNRTILRMCEDRLDFLRGLRTWGHFGRGWQRRVDSVSAEALRMAATTPTPPPTPDDASELLAWLSRRPDNWKEVINWLAEMQ